MYQLKNLFPDDIKQKADLLEENLDEWIEKLHNEIGDSYKVNPYKYLDIYAKLYMHEFIKYTNQLEHSAVSHNRKALRVWNMFCITIDRIRQWIDITIPSFGNDYSQSDAIDYVFQVHTVVSEIISVAVSQELDIDPSYLIKIGHRFINTINFIQNMDDEI